MASTLLTVLSTRSKSLKHLWKLCALSKPEIDEFHYWDTRGQAPLNFEEVEINRIGKEIFQTVLKWSRVENIWKFTKNIAKELSSQGQHLLWFDVGMNLVGTFIGGAVVLILWGWDLTELLKRRWSSVYTDWLVTIRKKITKQPIVQITPSITQPNSFVG